MSITAPTDISGLVAWFSAEAETGYADDADITLWNDISGNNNDTTGTGAAYPKWRSTAGPSGGPAIQFPNGSSWYSLANIMSGATAGEAFAWIKTDVAATEHGHWKWGTAGTNSHYPYGGQIYDDFGSTTRKDAINPVDDLTVWRRVNVHSAASDWELRIDETARHTTTTNTVAWNTTPAIGNKAAGGQNKWYTCFVLFNRKLTTGERADMISWMNANPGGGTASGPTIITVNPALSGSGTLTADVGSRIDVSGSLSGSGTLSAAYSMRTSLTINLTGSGTLDATGSYRLITYAPVLTILDSTLTQSPTSVVVAFEGGPPDTDVTFEIDGDPTTDYVGTTDTEGNLGPLSVPVPDTVMAGSHTLVADVDDPASSDPDATFSLERDPFGQASFIAPDADPVEIPEALLSTGVRRWVLQDLMPDGLGSYIFPANPDAADPWPFERTLSAAHTTAIGGQFHITEPADEVHTWSFSGTSLDEEFHNTLRSWANLNRRFYLHDHRNRAWTITIVGTDLKPRRRTIDGNDWVVDYQVSCLIYGRNWKVPQ